MALTDKLTAIGNAIREKTGGSSLIPLGDMPAEIRSISSSENITWHQCPEAVRNYLTYLEENPYNPNDYSYTYITNYAPASAVSGNTKPIGKEIDGVTFYDNEPNVALPFSTANSSGTLTAIDKLRWYNTTPAQPAEGSVYSRGRNTRDLGGWGCDGGIIKYGMLIRGSEPNPVDKELMVDKIGIKTEVQLLPVNEQATNYKKKSAWGIDWAGNDTDSDSVYSVSDSPTLWKKILDSIFDSVIHNKPVYFHCGVGADRTGIVAMMLEGLLGVSQSDIDQDFELTDFDLGWKTLDAGIYRSRAYSTYGSVISAIKSIPLVGGLTDNFRNHCISFVLSLGISLDEINAFRAACINGTPETITANLLSYTITKNGEHVSFNNNETSIKEFQGYQTEITPDFSYVITDITVMMGGNNITNSVFSGTEALIRHDISKTLNNSSMDNTSEKVIDNESYAAIITPDDNYAISSITVTMGNVDITENAVVLMNEEGKMNYLKGIIAIPKVTGNIIIAVTTKPIQYDNLFDENTASYNSRIRNVGAIGSGSGRVVTAPIDIANISTLTIQGVTTVANNDGSYLRVAAYSSSKGDDTDYLGVKNVGANVYTIDVASLKTSYPTTAYVRLEITLVTYPNSITKADTANLVIYGT